MVQATISRLPHVQRRSCRISMHWDRWSHDFHFFFFKDSWWMLSLTRGEITVAGVVRYMSQFCFFNWEDWQYDGGAHSRVKSGTRTAFSVRRIRSETTVSRRSTQSVISTSDHPSWALIGKDERDTEHVSREKIHPIHQNSCSDTPATQAIHLTITLSEPRALAAFRWAQ